MGSIAYFGINDLHDSHVTSYYDYLDAVEEEACNDQLREAEGKWEDNGCY